MPTEHVRFFKNKRIVLYDTLIKQVRQTAECAFVGGFSRASWIGPVYPDFLSWVRYQFLLLYVER